MFVVASTCLDGLINGLETDQDCGGTTCGTCADTKKCLVGPDCVNKICGLSKTCVGK